MGANFQAGVKHTGKLCSVVFLLSKKSYSSLPLFLDMGA
jgi:hypothetical protein